MSLAKRAAAAQVATTFVMQGIDNKREGLGFFGQKTSDPSTTFKPGSKQWRAQAKQDTSFDPMINSNN